MSPAPRMALRLFGGEQAPQHPWVLWTFFCLGEFGRREVEMPGDLGVLKGALLPALSRRQDQQQNTFLMRAPSQIPCSSPRAAHPSVHFSAHPGSRQRAGSHGSPSPSSGLGTAHYHQLGHRDGPGQLSCASTMVQPHSKRQCQLLSFHPRKTIG